MKRFSHLIILSVFISCGQTKKDSQTMLKDISNSNSQEINAENVVDYLADKVKTFDKHPVYAIRPLQNNCIFELLVNGLPIYREFGLEKLATPLRINDRILKSGPQTITYRLYPIGNLMVEEFGKGETITTLRRNTSMKIEVIEYKNSKTGTGLSDEIIIAKHTSPINKKSGAFLGTDLPYYENTFTFNADVPYENEGWLNGEDLSQFDKKELEKLVIDKNLQIKRLYEEKDLDSLVDIEFINSYIYHKANYRKKEEIQEIFDQYKEDVLKEKKFHPLEGYQMELYANNRVATIRYSIITPPDLRFQGQPALYYTYKDEYGTLADFISLYFYLPKGKALKVENLRLL